MRRPAKLAFVMAVAILAVWWIARPPAPRSPSAPARTAADATTPPSSPRPGPAAAAPARSLPPVADPNRSHLLDDLNQPAGTIQSDLRLLHEVFAAWQTNFPRDGNPVGENAEIVRSLTGDNPLQLALVPKDHAALNNAGELTDRWGTPFRFHQLTGTRMEIRSAGPDRRFGTADDAQFTP
jgi:hypothetical protein